MTTTNNWKVNADGDWATVADWSLGRLPNSGDAVTISTANVHSITHNSGADIIDKLTVGKDFFTMGGGSLDILTTASFADGYTQTGGSLTVGAISVTGPLKLLGGASEGATAFTATGTTTLANYTLGGASSLAVSSTANETGQVTLGDGSDVGAAITVAAAGAYDVAGDFGIGQGAASATFTNGGTLAKTAGSGTSVIGVSINSTGTISAASGELEFTGPTNVISGKLSGVGQVAFGAGVTTLSASSITVGTLGIYGTATVNLKVNPTFSGTFIDSSNGTNTLNLGTHTLTLAGASGVFAGNSGTADITGSGTLANKSELTLSNVIVGGTVKISNAKTINQTGQVTLGDGSGGIPSITNLSTGAYDFTADTGLGANNAASVFTNQGLLEKTVGASGQGSIISLAVTNSGTIEARAGGLIFSGSLVNTGTISGAASVEVVGGASVTLNAGTVLSVANFDLLNASTLNIGASLSYAGVFNDTSGGNNQINLGANTLTLSGASNTVVGTSGITDIAGVGKLANTGTMTLANAVIDGTAQIDNAGTINQSATVTIGGGGGQAASLVNAKGAKFNVTGAFTINEGAATTSHFNNSGAVSVTAGNGTAVFATNFNNLTGGVLNIATGALESVGTLSNSGTISGKTLVLANGGQTNLAAGSTLSVAEVDLDDTAELSLGASFTYAGHFVDASSGSNEINLGASTLTLSGQADFNPTFGNDVIAGSGTLKLTHAATFEGNTTEVAGTAHLDIDSKVIVTGGLEIGDGGANTAEAVIAATGTYDLLADTGVSRGASDLSTLTNNGLFEKTAGTGTSVISANFVNNGTITVTSGTLEFLKGTLSGSGTINGTVSFDASGDELITAAAPSKAAVPAASAHKTLTTTTSAGSVHLLAQAVASFGTDLGLMAHWGDGVAPKNDVLLGPAGGSYLSPWHRR
jgi:uncharacterized lipoprotein NlpE involved in copper resistance